MSKYLLKFIKYILTSSKDWTRVRLLSYRDVYLCSTSISRQNIDIVLYMELVLKSDTTTTSAYRKRAASDEDIMGICKDTQSRLLSLLTISDSQKYICITHREVLFRFCISQVGLHCSIRKGE